MIRIYILGGQYGVFGTLGTVLAPRLQRYGRVSVHQWNDSSIYLDAATQPPANLIVAIGYSLGANTVAQDFPEFLNKRGKKVKLVIAYDPSRQSPRAYYDKEHGEYREVVPANVERAVCFYNPSAWYYGGAKLVGAAKNQDVAIDQIAMYHLPIPGVSSVPTSSQLHDITEREVQKIAAQKMRTLDHG
jgi:hypothetical protein